MLWHWRHISLSLFLSFIYLLWQLKVEKRFWAALDEGSKFARLLSLHKRILDACKIYCKPTASVWYSSRDTQQVTSLCSSTNTNPTFGSWQVNWAVMIMTYRVPPSQCWVINGTLKTKREVTPCQTITVELRGAAARTQSDVSGEYSPIGDWSWGRQVFKHRERNLYLRVKLDGWGGWGAWCIGDKPDDHLGGDNVGGDHVGSQVTTWCPADPRAAISQTYNYKSWIYIINGMEQGDIRVKCKIHSWPASE